MKTDKELLSMLLEVIDYSFYNSMERDYNKDLTYPVIDKVKYIKRVMQERPKFRVGDVVRNKENPFIVPTKIIAIRDNEYVGWGEKAFIPFDKQDKWELVEEPTTSVWHDANTLPSDPKAVIVEHNKYSTSICRAEQMSRVKGAKWAYIDDLLKL